jgi:hypothetical protein
MKLKISIPGIKLFFIAPVSLLLLASCSSYQYSGSDRDGVYGDNRRVYSEQEQYATQDNKASYYKNLFAEESDLYYDLLAENAIFTDVESYTSTGGDYTEQSSNYQGGNAPWGQDPDSYSINIHNNGYYGGFYNPYWGGGYYGYNPYWGPGHYGPRHWGSSWSMGFGGYYPYSGFGYGYGYGYSIHPYFYGGGGWHNPYNYHYNRNNYFRQNVAYNTGRRNAVSSYRDSDRSNLRNAVNLDSRRQNSNYSRSIRNIRNSDDQSGVTRRSIGDYNTTTRRSSGDYNATTRRNSDNRNLKSVPQSTSRSSRGSDTYSRPATTNRSNTSTVRSSGTTRSSGQGRSSSGGSSSTNRGRGN